MPYVWFGFTFTYKLHKLETFSPKFRGFRHFSSIQVNGDDDDDGDDIKKKKLFESKKN